MINSLTGVLVRFRQHQVALMCDIEKMFHQFQVRESDRICIFALLLVKSRRHEQLTAQGDIQGDSTSLCCCFVTQLCELWTQTISQREQPCISCGLTIHSQTSTQMTESPAQRQSRRLYNLQRKHVNCKQRVDLGYTSLCPTMFLYQTQTKTRKFTVPSLWAKHVYRPEK